MIHRHEPKWFWLIAFVMLAIGIGLRDPWPADEPRFALVAKTMVDSGNWLFPMRGDELYPDKPPVFMWVLGGFYAALGSIRWSFLLPSLLSGLGVLWLIRDLGRRLWPSDVHAGVYASGACLFAVMFTYQFKRAQIDPLLTFEMTVAGWAFLRHFCEKPSLRLWLLGWLMAGLGIITKGVGVIALFVLVPVCLAQFLRWRHVHAKTLGWRAVLGPVVLLLPILLWLVPMLMAVSDSPNPAYQAYADNILFKQTAKRYANPWGHTQPWFYFIEVILLQWLPVTLLLPFAVPKWREALKEKDARILILLGWIALTVVFFSLSRGKREVYILPMLPFFCLALGPYVGGLISRHSVQWTLRGFASMLATSLMIAGFGMASAVVGWCRVFGDSAQPIGWMLGVAGALSLAAIIWQWKHPERGVLATLFALWCGLSLVAYPLLTDDSSARKLMRDVGMEIGPGAELALVQWKEQNLLQAERPAVTFGFLTGAKEQWQSAWHWGSQGENRWILAESIAMPDCMRQEAATDMGVYNRRQWFLVRATAMCPASAEELTNDAVKETPGTED